MENWEIYRAFVPESQNESVVDLDLIFKLSHQRRRITQNTTDSKPFTETSSLNISWVRFSAVKKNLPHLYRLFRTLENEVPHNLGIHGTHICFYRFPFLGTQQISSQSSYEVASSGIGFIREGDKFSLSLWFIRNLRIPIYSTCKILLCITQTNRKIKEDKKYVLPTWIIFFLRFCSELTN